MKRCAILDFKQKQELEDFIQRASDGKEIRRAQAVLLVDRETDYVLIQRLTGFKERTVLIFRQRYLAQGLKGLEHKRKGKTKALLTRSQRDEIISFLTTSTPYDHGIDSAFWSTSILGWMIKAKYGVVYKSKKPFYLLFEEAKFSFHKPGQVYERRDSSKVQQWRDDLEPKLAAAFQEAHTVMLCEDEMVYPPQQPFKKCG